MTTSHREATLVRPAPDPEHQDVRISFRQPISTSGAIDAAWWPRSLDLTAEVPALVEALWAANREITRITYNLQAWDDAPRRVVVRGRAVRLGGFATSDRLTVRLSDSSRRERIDVLVVPPETDPEVAQRALMLAAVEGSGLSAAEILSSANGVKPNASRGSQ